MTMRSHLPTEKIECPLCAGAGELTRAEILDPLGAKDFARVAQLSAEEAFRLLAHKHRNEEQSLWSRFEAELAKRTAEIREQHKDALRSTQSERDDLTRRVEDCLREVAQFRERNQELETEMAKVARIGKREEMDFADEARTWAGVWISDKLPRNGDFILCYRAPNGDPTEPKILIDNKDKSSIAESDIDKIVRDARERAFPPKCSKQRFAPTRTTREYMARSRASGNWLSGRLSFFTRPNFASAATSEVFTDKAAWRLRGDRQSIHCIRTSAARLDSVSVRGLPDGSVRVTKVGQ
jgi:hypothetical protein